MTKACRLLFVIGLLVLSPSLARAEGESTTIGGIKVVYWPPVTTSTSPKKQPVLLFSHSFRGCATQSPFLTEALAANGYWVFAPEHADANCDGLKYDNKVGEVDMYKPRDWTEKSYTSRRDDMKKLWDAIQKDSRFRDKIDSNRLGLVGHSLGGYTVMGLAGAWSSWKMPGVKAVLALAPYIQPFVLQKSVKGLAAPIMYQTGSLDPMIRLATIAKTGAYEWTPEPKYYVEFQGAPHTAWTDQNRQFYTPIVIYAQAFLDHYVKGEPARKDLTMLDPGVAELRYDSQLGSKDLLAQTEPPPKQAK